MDLKVNSGVWGTMFGVPCIVADNFLKLASGEQIKVLLYLLRCSGRFVTSDEISMNTGVSPTVAEEAVMFWQQANVLTSENNISTHNIMTAPAPVQQVQEAAAAPAAVVPNAEQPSPTADTAPPKKSNLRPSDIADMIKENSNIAELFKIAESILGTLNSSMQNSLIWMYNYLGLKKEVIITLIGYCIEINKPNPSYIEKIASNWTEKDINTLEAATAEVERLNSAHTYLNEVRKAFDMQHNPTSNQQKFIAKWQESGFSVPLLHYAYERTIEQINKLSFEYINKILISWNESGFKTPEDVKASEEDYRKNKKSGQKDSPNSGIDTNKYNFVINNI